MSDNKPSGFYKRLYASTSKELFFPDRQNQPLSQNLPVNGYRNMSLLGANNSRKIFVGGLPPDITEDEIKFSFKQFGNFIVDWPCKTGTKSQCPPKGYTFIMFDHENSVQQLLHVCMKNDKKYYIHVSSSKVKNKPAEVRPWLISDTNYISDTSKTLDPRKTVFVANLPCPIKAGDLAAAVKSSYGGVCYVGIDVDPIYKYPKTTGRITFDYAESYKAVINARFVKIRTGTTFKEVDVKPFVMNDQKCDICFGSRYKSEFAPYFCINVSCLQYYCMECWDLAHGESPRKHHKPILLGAAEFCSSKASLKKFNC